MFLTLVILKNVPRDPGSQFSARLFPRLTNFHRFSFGLICTPDNGVWSIELGEGGGGCQLLHSRNNTIIYSKSPD